MKTYLFYLEPYVLLDICKNNIILINTLDNNKLTFCDFKTSKILQQLMELKSATVKFTDLDFTSSFFSFIQKIREAYMGDYFEIESSSTLPFQWPLFNSYKGFMKERIFKENINYISDITLLLDNNNESGFSEYESDTFIKELISFLCFFKGNSNVRLIIKGENVLSYKYLNDIINYIGDEKQITLSLDYKFWCSNSLLKNHDNVDVKVNLDMHNLNKDLLGNIFHDTDCNIEYVFSISSLEEYNLAVNIIKENRLDKHKIIPSFNGSNSEFLKEYVFIDKEDIQSIAISKKQFIANHFINSFAFGKIYILSNGEIYSDLSESPIGTIHNSPIEISNECIKKSQWTKTRFVVNPCKECIYRSLCPPIGIMESSIGTNQLCFKNKLDYIAK